MTPVFILILGPGRADLTLQALADASPAFFDSGYQEFDLDPPEPFGITLGRYGDGGTGMFSFSPLPKRTSREASASNDMTCRVIYLII